MYSVFSRGRTFSGEQLQGDHRSDAGIGGFITLTTFGYGKAAKSGFSTVESTPKLFNAFARDTRGLFTGPNHAKLRAAAYLENLKLHNNLIKETNKMFRSNFQVFKDIGQTSNVIKIVNDQSQN